MEKINLEKAREHLAALNEELDVKTFNEGVIERLSSYIDDYIHRQVENLTMHDHITDCEFSINYSNQVVLDDFYVDTDDIARELNAGNALEYAIDRYEAEVEVENEIKETPTSHPSPTPPDGKITTEIADQLNSNQGYDVIDNTGKNEG